MFLVVVPVAIFFLLLFFSTMRLFCVRQFWHRSDASALRKSNNNNNNNANVTCKFSSKQHLQIVFFLNVPLFFFNVCSFVYLTNTWLLCLFTEFAIAVAVIVVLFRVNRHIDIAVNATVVLQSCNNFDSIVIKFRHQYL